MTAVRFNAQGKLPALAGELPGDDKGSVTGGTSKLDEITAGLFTGCLLVDALLGAIVLMGLVLS